MKILMIGNSFCYYYTRELFGIAQAAGVHMKICNVYYSGCPLEKHLLWYDNEEAHYEFFTTDEHGRRGIKPVDLRYCLAAEDDWDVISIQEGSGAFRSWDVEQSYSGAYGKVERMLSILRERFPKSKLCWHQVWSNQVGFQGPYTPQNVATNFVNVSPDVKILTKERQRQAYALRREVSLRLCEAFGMHRIPSGDAWENARADARVGDILCNSSKSHGGDNYHDGDLGGGRYLNACVWFESLTGISCVGNTFRPDYELSEEKIAALQQAAHEAVAAMNG